jgi:glycosyltransferase involved in cell wall biosynthesis
MAGGKRIALVHDYWVTLRGGERIFLGLTRLFPEADCFALIRDPHLGSGDHKALAMRTTALQWIPHGYRHFRSLLPLYPLAARSLDLRGYDLVISSSSGFCHGARTSGVHVCYCHSPLRYAWNEFDATIRQQRSPLGRAALSGVLRYVRRMDYAAAQRVSTYVANSRAVQQRIGAFYGRRSVIVHPFVDTARLRPSDDVDDYFLVVSQLLPYKRVDLAIEACNHMRRRLFVVGDGPERPHLERIAGPSVRFLGRVSEPDLIALYARCAALLQCGEEDFGMAALEAQASGRPVLAFGAGGAVETVLHGRTGLRIPEQTVECVLDALARFDSMRFETAELLAHAERFNEDRFRSAMLQVVRDAG